MLGQPPLFFQYPSCPAMCSLVYTSDRGLLQTVHMFGSIHFVCSRTLAGKSVILIPPMIEATVMRVLAARRLLHPFMPFVTEELWQRLPGRREQAGGVASIMIASYPAAQPSWADQTSEAELALILDIVKAARSLRSGACTWWHMATQFPRSSSVCSGTLQREIGPCRSDCDGAEWRAWLAIRRSVCCSISCKAD